MSFDQGLQLVAHGSEKRRQAKCKKMKEIYRGKNERKMRMKQFLIYVLLFLLFFRLLFIFPRRPFLFHEPQDRKKGRRKADCALPFLLLSSGSENAQKRKEKPIVLLVRVRFFVLVVGVVLVIVYSCLIVRCCVFVVFVKKIPRSPAVLVFVGGWVRLFIPLPPPLPLSLPLVTAAFSLSPSLKVVKKMKS